MEKAAREKKGTECRMRPTLWSLLFEAQLANVSLIDSDDAVVLLEETLLLRLASALQTLHQQALGPGKWSHNSSQIKSPNLGAYCSDSAMPRRAVTYYMSYQAGNGGRQVAEPVPCIQKGNKAIEGWKKQAEEGKKKSETIQRSQ